MNGMVKPAPSTLAPVRWAFFTIGLVSVSLGTIGMFLPVLPTTIFYIIGLWAFKRSSPRLEAWLLNHKVFGATLRDWDENKWMRRRTKILAISMVWLCISGSMFLVRKPTTKGILLAVAISLTVYLWTRRTKPETPKN